MYLLCVTELKQPCILIFIIIFWTYIYQFFISTPFVFSYCKLGYIERKTNLFFCNEKKKPLVQWVTNMC